MNRIALIAAAVSLGAGAAMAATPNSVSGQISDQHRHHHRMAMSMARGAGSTAARETRALNLLEAQGYGSFTDFAPAGKDFTAKVTQNGHVSTMRIDPESGQVRPVG